MESVLVALSLVATLVIAWLISKSKYNPPAEPPKPAPTRKPDLEDVAEIQSDTRDVDIRVRRLRRRLARLRANTERLRDDRSGDDGD